MRQFVSMQPLSDNGGLVASGGDYRHLRRVLRVRVGDMITALVHGGERYSMTVAMIDDNAQTITLQRCANGSDADDARSPCTSCPPIFLLQFIPRLAKMEVIIRQAVECAVDTVVCVAGQYSLPQYVEALRGGATKRMQRIIKEAMEQSGRTSPLVTTPAMTLDEAIQWWQNRCGGGNSYAVVLSERAQRGARATNEGDDNCRQIEEAAIAIGSEGGISCDEEKRLNAAGFRSVHFGECNIMRCETAALYGVASLRERVASVTKQGA